MLDVAIETHLNAFHLDLSFRAELGQTTVLLGESGAGKSTVLRTLAGLLQPHHGHIVLRDTIYYDSERRIMLPPQERPFAYVFQEYVLFPHLTVFENVAFGLRAQRLSRSFIQRQVGAILERVHLSGFERRRPVQLSGGQQQRVALARALVLQPQLLLLDEPLAALDVQTRREVRQELRQILQESEVTCVMVTHHYLDALLFGQQILVLERGRLVQRGGQRELRASPRSSYIAELIGVNLFQGRIIGYEAHTLCLVQVTATARPLEVVAALREPYTPEELPVLHTEVYVIVDPRSVTLYTRPPDGSARNVFYGEIVQILHLGSGPEEGLVRVNVLLDRALPPLTVELTETSVARMDLREGSFVYATFKATEANAYI
ncbi:MAG TPA: ABC transporter ATP-binding protein [Ktedonobacteraceae bacterium]|nr:ABC transporter ATP-binding protein [Ktedonobacteraceae bacterium]